MESQSQSPAKQTASSYPQNGVCSSSSSSFSSTTHVIAVHQSSCSGTELTTTVSQSQKTLFTKTSTDGRAYMSDSVNQSKSFQPVTVVSDSCYSRQDSGMSTGLVKPRKVSSTACKFRNTLQSVLTTDIAERKTSDGLDW